MTVHQTTVLALSANPAVATTAAELPVDDAPVREALTFDPT